MVTTRASKLKLKESEEVEKLENKRKLRSGSKGTKEGKMEMRASNRKQESGIRKRAKNKEKMENSTTFKQKQEREKEREEGRMKKKMDKEKDNEETEEEKRAWQMLEKRIKRSTASRDKKRRSAKEEAKKIEESETEKKNLKLFIAKLIEDSVGQTNDLGCAWAALAGGSYDREFKERMKQAIRSLCLENPESYSFIASDNIMGELLWLAAIFRRILLVQKWDSEIVDLVHTAAHRATDRLVYEVKEISKILDLASGIHSETWNDSSQVWNDESRGKVEELIRYIDWWMVNSGSLKESLDSWLKNSEGEIFESCKVVEP